MSAASIPPRGLTTNQTAEYVGIAPKTLRNRLSDKDDPFPVRPRYIGNKPIFLREEIDRYLEGLPNIPARPRKPRPSKGKEEEGIGASQS